MTKPDSDVQRLSDEELVGLERLAASAIDAIPAGQNPAVHERNWIIATQSHAILPLIAELRELRALLATPDHGDRVRWHDNGRGARIIVRLHNEEHVLQVDSATQIGAALIRAALQARGGK